jgi:hypothetical protein
MGTKDHPPDQSTSANQPPRTLDDLSPLSHGLTRFARRLFPLLVSLFFLAVVWLDFGDSYNVPALIWYDDYPFLQIISGFSITLLLGYLWLTVYLVDSRCDDYLWSRDEPSTDRSPRALAEWLGRLFLPDYPDSAEEPHWSALRRYLAVTWLPLLLLIALAAFRDVRRHFLFPFGMLLALAANGLVLRGIHALHGYLVKHGGRLSKIVAYARGDGRWLRTLAEIVFGGLIIGYAMLCLVQNTAGFPPIVSLCLIFGVLGGGASMIWFYFPRYGWLAFFGLFVYVVFCNSWAYKLRFPGLDGAYAPNALVKLATFEEPVVTVDEDSKAGKDEKKRLRDLCQSLVEYAKTNQLGTVPIDRPLPESATYDDLFFTYRQLLEDIRADEEQWLESGWRQRLREARGKPDKPRLAVIAVSGGANRSALWVTLVLQKLEQELRGPGVNEQQSLFPRHIRVICGASGGMVGAARYVATLDEKGHSAGFDPASTIADHLSPIVNNLVFREVPYLFLPVTSYSHDRGQSLEDALGRTTPQLNMTFAQLAAGERAGWRPSLIFSPMIVEDGRRLLVSNLQLPYITASKGRLLIEEGAPPASPESEPATSQRTRHFYTRAVPQPKQGAAKHLYQDRYSQSALEFFRLFPDARSTFALKTAARMNASFPYISPAVDLPTAPPRRVVDAGYYDNYGVNVAAGWIYRHKDWIDQHTSGIVLIQIRDSESNQRRRSLVDPDEEKQGDLWRRISTGIQWITGPAAGAASAWGAVTSFRNDEQIQTLNDLFNKPPSKVIAGRDFFTTVVFERPGRSGMNWYLSDDDRNEILHGFDESYLDHWSPTDHPNPNPKALELLKTWWRDGGS